MPAVCITGLLVAYYLSISADRKAHDGSVAAVPVCPRCLCSQESGTKLFQVIHEPAFSLPKVILLEHNADPWCKSLLGDKEDREKEVIRRKLGEKIEQSSSLALGKILPGLTSLLYR